MKPRQHPTLPITTSLVALILPLIIAAPTSLFASGLVSPSQRLFTGDGADSPASLLHAPAFNQPPRLPIRQLPGRDDPDEFFTFRYMVSEDGGENWSDILGAGDAGMYDRDQNGNITPIWPNASYNFGVVATQDNDLHFIAVLNGFSDEEELNPQNRVNGVYDVMIDPEGNRRYTLIDAQDNGVEMTWADAGIGVNDTLHAIWVTISNNTASIWSAWSGNNGAGWSQPRQILANLDIGGATESEMPYPHMTYHVGQYFYVIYQTPNPDNGRWDHRILRVPATLQGNIVTQNPNVATASFLSYYVASVSPIDQDVQAGWVYFAVRNQDNSGATIGRSNNA